MSDHHGARVRFLAEGFTASGAQNRLPRSENSCFPAIPCPKTTLRRAPGGPWAPNGPLPLWNINIYPRCTQCAIFGLRDGAAQKIMIYQKLLAIFIDYCLEEFMERA